MPELPVSFQLAIELSNVFPVGELVRHAGGALYNQVLNFAHDLQKSGSDLVVEEDLVAIFGRARINTEIERQFREDVLQNTTIVKFHDGSGLNLDARPGPTISCAIADKDPRYLSTVIQLSLLGWTLGRTSLCYHIG